MEYPYDPDDPLLNPPDMRKASFEEKQDLVNEALALAGKILISVYVAIDAGLEYRGTITNSTTGDKFILSFKKEATKPGEATSFENP